MRDFLAVHDLGPPMRHGHGHYMTRIASHQAAGVVCLLAARKKNNTPWQNVNNVNGNGVEQGEKMSHWSLFFLFLGRFTFIQLFRVFHFVLGYSLFAIALELDACCQRRLAATFASQIKCSICANIAYTPRCRPALQREMAEKEWKIRGSCGWKGNSQTPKLVGNFWRKSNWENQCETDDSIQWNKLQHRKLVCGSFWAENVYPIYWHSPVRHVQKLFRR